MLIFALNLHAEILKAILASYGTMPVEAGFADQSHFTRAFRRQFGVTPGRYRAM